MPRYVFVFRARPDRQPTSAEGARWPVWFEQISGSIADFGNRVGETRVVGPTTGGEEVISGYIVVNGDNLDVAAKIAEGCPILDQGGRVEVGELVES